MLVTPDSPDSIESSRAVADDERWLLAERIAASPGFARSPRLSQLLLYLCRHHLAGQDDRLSEQSIAADIFGRAHDFDSASDTIVRSHMLRLRQKLEAYFQEEGAGEDLQITIPRGRYVPSFQSVNTPVPSAASTAISQELPQEASETAPRRPWLQSVFTTPILIAVLCGLCLLAFAGWRFAARPNRSATKQFWQMLFPKNSTTLLVAADSGLVLFHGITGENTSLGEYVTHDLRHAAEHSSGMKPETALSLANRRYTSFVDLELFNRLTHTPEALAGTYSIRYARDLSINELKNSNAIFSGSVDADPWIETFEQGMNFVMKDDLNAYLRSFVNRKPQPGELPQYISDKREYGVLAFLPNSSGNGNVLIIEGTSVAGTEAASDFLFDSSKLEPFLEKIRQPDGTLPGFEVLIATESLNGSAAPLTAMAWRIHKR